MLVLIKKTLCERLKSKSFFHRLKLFSYFLVSAHLIESSAHAQMVARVYSAGQRFLQQVAPDSLAFADVDIGPANIPITYAAKNEQTGEFPTTFMGYQVLISGHLMQIISIQNTPALSDQHPNDLRHTAGLLRIGIYIPPEVPLSGEVILGQSGARVEIFKEDAQRISQSIGVGQTSMLSTSPQFFINRSTVYGGAAISINDVTGLAGLVSGVDQDYDYNYTLQTPNLTTGQLEPTRVILFGTGFRNAQNTDTSNDLAESINVAEAYKCQTYMGFVNGATFILDVDVEYIGPVKGGMPGMDEIIIRLSPEMKPLGVDRSVEQQIWLVEKKTGRNTNTNEGGIRASIHIE